MKIFFIASSVYILYLMKGPFRPTHDPNLDTFKVEFLFIGAFVASLVFNYDYSVPEVCFLRHTVREAFLISRFFGRLAFGSKV